MAPSTSPISMAFVVPMAWEADPMAIPLATGSVMWKSRQTVSAIMLPMIPVMIIQATVIVTIPPISSDTPMPMAVVMDLEER